MGAVLILMLYTSLDRFVKNYFTKSELSIFISCFLEIIPS